MKHKKQVKKHHKKQHKQAKHEVQETAFVQADDGLKELESE
jgi:hypothetical protein